MQEGMSEGTVRRADRILQAADAMKVTDGMVEAYSGALVNHPGLPVRERCRVALAAVFEVARRDVLCDRMAHGPESALQRSRDVVERAGPFMRQCGPCDFGLPEYGCACPEEDFRGVVADLVTEIETLRARVLELESRG